MAFIGLQPPSEVRSAIDRKLATLRQQVTGIDWVLPDDFHITLKFFRWSPTSDIDTISRLMVRLASDQQEFSLSLRHLSFFTDSRARPRVVWLEVVDTEALLMPLMKHLDAGMASIGVAPNRVQPIPHLTVGRVQPDKVFDIKSLELYPVKGELCFTANALVLMKRRKESAETALYRQLCRYGFSEGSSTAPTLD